MLTAIAFGRTRHGDVRSVRLHRRPLRLNPDVLQHAQVNPVDQVVAEHLTVSLRPHFHRIPRAAFQARVTVRQRDQPELDTA